jgi:hypothetical protein
MSEFQREAYDKAIQDYDNLKESVRNLIDKINNSLEDTWENCGEEEALDEIEFNVDSFKRFLDNL